ncbi:tetratricopeptide repeat protein [Ktedonosporobacter rubrisoli]|uniref:non-specific serine/threonine protein kinase n=1 Tax=Ktedonosporobacter rubrisoli TaxID=2509675 RepID=A0A4P6JZT8_KTERU|nr:serine/threonine-protein kinase [Ktedonosporobacter rubrisoli]QBD81357.1 tetratricopeptide repeat protein [Ktedonosporobacter rubrisoli]
MAQNYPSDPNNGAYASSSAVPSSGPGNSGATPDSSLASSAQPNAAGGSSSGQFVATPSSNKSTQEGENVRHRRLSSGVMLSAGRYQIDRLIAAGGMGAVYKAIDTRFKRPCAVKEMLDEFHNESERNQAVEWFSREATLLLDLNHPCIPRVRDFFMEEGRHYLVMDFIEGRTLGDILEQDGKVAGVNGAHGIEEARARSWAQQVCSVLGYLHRQNPPIIFRDLKPSNIMVTGRDEIKLIDFGIARTFQSQRQATIIMTIGYAPPEQLHGMPEPRSDLYALGATLHRLLTHHDAVNNKPSIFSFPPVRTLRPDISPAFEQVLMKALAPALEQRWPNAMEMERALMNLPPISAVPPAMLPNLPGGAAPRPVNPATPSSAFPRSGTPSTPVSPTPAPGTGPQSGTGPHQGTGPSTHTTTGPAGPHIAAALAHLAGGRIEPAHAAVMQAFGLEPNNALVHKIFGQVFARRVPPQIDYAIRAYNRSLSLNPEDAETHKLVGDVSLFLRQQPLQAIPAYIQSLRLKPEDFETHQRLGQCYDKTGQLDAALREYQEAAHLAPKQPPQPAVHYALGQLAMRMNRFAVAEQAFVQVLVINPADHQTRFLLSQVYEHENKFEDAFRECSYVIGPLGANPAVQQMYQRLRNRLGR